jgi:hypothetical protein
VVPVQMRHEHVIGLRGAWAYALQNRFYRPSMANLRW